MHILLVIIIITIIHQLLTFIDKYHFTSIYLPINQLSIHHLPIHHLSIHQLINPSIIYGNLSLPMHKVDFRGSVVDVNTFSSRVARYLFNPRTPIDYSII